MWNKKKKRILELEEQIKKFEQNFTGQLDNLNRIIYTKNSEIKEITNIKDNCVLENNKILIRARKAEQDIKDIINSENDKPKIEVIEEINYVHTILELKSKLITSDYITNKDNEDKDIDALNSLLIKLLPYISSTTLSTTENDNITITNEITILTNK